MMVRGGGSLFFGRVESGGGLRKRDGHNPE